MSTLLKHSRELYRKLLEKHQNDYEWICGKCLLAALEIRDPPTAEHSLAVGYTAYRIGIRIYDGEQAERLFLAGLVHDIGKLQMEDEILKGSQPLSPSQREKLCLHVVEGVQLLNKLGFSEDITEFCRYHHERLDGSGYPNRLKKIPPIGRIAAVADVYSALKLPRRYRPVIYSDLNILEQMSKDQGFDQEILAVLKAVCME